MRPDARKDLVLLAAIAAAAVAHRTALREHCASGAVTEASMAMNLAGLALEGAICGLGRRTVDELVSAISDDDDCDGPAAGCKACGGTIVHVNDCPADPRRRRRAAPGGGGA